MDAEKVLEYNMALEISHLVVNGCSFTYCQGLEDPATQGWPALLSKKLGVPVVNIGIMGSGNDSIYRRTAEYFYLNKVNNSKPFFIVAFSQALRREEFLKEYKGKMVDDFRTLASYGHEPIERAIFEHLDTTGVYFMERRKLLHWLSIINLFKANNIEYFTTSYMQDHQQSIHVILNNYESLYNEIHKDVNKLKDFFEVTKGMDKTSCMHDGPKAQQVVADYCYAQLIEKYKEIIPIKTQFTTVRNFMEQTDVSQKYNPWHTHAWIDKEYINVQPQ